MSRFTWRIGQTYAAQSIDDSLQGGRTFEDNASFPPTFRFFTWAVPGASGGTGAP